MTDRIVNMIKDDSFSDIDIIEAIVRRFPNPEERKEIVTDYRPNLLVYALSMSMRFSLVRFLLRSGADTNFMSHHARTHILVFCCVPSSGCTNRRNRDEMCDIDNAIALLAYGADPNAPGQIRSVLYMSIAFNGNHIVPTLLVHGARMSDDEYATLRITHPDKLKIVTDFYHCVSLRRIAFHHIAIARVKMWNER